MSSFSHRGVQGRKRSLNQFNQRVQRPTRVRTPPFSFWPRPWVCVIHSGLFVTERFFWQRGCSQPGPWDDATGLYRFPGGPNPDPLSPRNPVSKPPSTKITEGRPACPQVGSRMMLGPPAVGSSVMDTGAGSGVVLFGGDSSFASKLAGTLAARRDGVARRSPVLESWEGLKDVGGSGVDRTQTLTFETQRVWLFADTPLVLGLRKLWMDDARDAVSRVYKMPAPCMHASYLPNLRRSSGRAMHGYAVPALHQVAWWSRSINKEARRVYLKETINKILSSRTTLII